ncbi:protein N-terminal glutamine amidohydrolase [Nerophis ophidion]|uniref:protein N-terminal glutamine amidohydrolase n=1 Tax=Nerophis ophidion TaxID=159077 RepID=UPI002AE0965F|nr:protein N-terminal glutamine amidohydrolase [Nerophis ophidion]XP_061752636.1 protein N-terminal glutamine amidohydrolase [Nerophis ophidion]
MEEDKMAATSRDKCQYTSCYCEENVWKVCELIRKEKSFPLEEFFVIFISNDNKKVPLWEQKSAQGQQPVIWDYHVVLLHVCPRSEAFLYDLDSVLPFPCTLKMYARHALRTDHCLLPEYHRKLRVVPADYFLLNFASDRSHMKEEDGSWKMPPPPYPPIHTADSSMNLQLFISMEPSVGWGHVYTLDHFLCHFLKEPRV